VTRTVIFTTETIFMLEEKMIEAASATAHGRNAVTRKLSRVSQVAKAQAVLNADAFDGALMYACNLALVYFLF
jgi:hypothetical protein